MHVSPVSKIYSFSYDRVIQKAGFHYFDCLLLNSYGMNSDCFMLFFESILHGNLPDGRFNPHKSARGSVQ
jgi:hypothetical protein